jgi:gluconolactonase
MVELRSKCVLLISLISSTLMGQNTIGTVEPLDPQFAQFVAADAAIEVLASGFRWAEGPVWVSELNGVLFSDVPENKVYLWTEEKGLRLFLSPSGMTEHAPHSTNEGANGLTLDNEGRLLLCQHGDRRIARLSSPFFEPPQYETVVAYTDGARFNSPNDITVLSNGDLLFTDPPYGLKQQDKDPLKELPYNGIFHWSKNNGITLLSKSLTRPNGIAVSKDEKTLYVANSDAQKSYIVAFDWNGKEASNERIFFDTKQINRPGPGLFDGLRVHSSGTLFATGPGGVLVISSDGRHLGTLRPGKATANCGFDENEEYLYLTSTNVLARIQILKP